MDDSRIYKVRLESYSHGTSSTPTSEVVFNVMPSIAESIVVEYQALDPIHMPGSFYVYKGTKSSSFELGDLKLVSRTPSEASRNQAIRHTLKGWTKPYFGLGTANGTSGAAISSASSETRREWQKVPQLGKTAALTAEDIDKVLKSNGYVSPGQVAIPGVPLSESQKQKLLTSSNKQKAQALLSQMYARDGLQSSNFNMQPGSYRRVPVQTATTTTTSQTGSQFLGAPPEVLYLTAYSNPSVSGAQLDRMTNIFRIPVVIESLGITYPNDVDYIPTIENEPFPIIMNISLSLRETHSPREFENFDLFKYRDGKLPGF